MALGRSEAYLLCIIAHKCYAFRRVRWSAAKIAIECISQSFLQKATTAKNEPCLDPHDEPISLCTEGGPSMITVESNQNIYA